MYGKEKKIKNKMGSIDMIPERRKEDEEVK
jgi:hypothetical protein